MAGLAEVVGRHAGDDGRLAVLIELKQLAIGPHVGAVAGDVNRYVAHDLDVPRVGSFADGRPLSEKKKLNVLLVADFIRQLALRGGHRRRLADRNRARPLAPSHAAMTFFERGVR